MLQFGIHTAEQLERLGAQRRTRGPRVAYNLLDVGDCPSSEQLSQFEDICFTMRLSNGTFRTSFRNRFADLNALMARHIAESFPEDVRLHVEDRAVSHGLTASEWAKGILAQFPKATFEASDLLLHLVELRLPDRSAYIAEPDGTLLQAIAPPFVVSLHHREPLRFPVNQLVAAWHRRRFESLALPDDWTERSSVGDLSIRRIPVIHPEARALAAADPRFCVVRRSVFDSEPGTCHVLRTMNILNRSYFDDQQLSEAAVAAFTNLTHGGLWALGRTAEDTFENHATILRRGSQSWEIVDRLGTGSEIESLVLENKDLEKPGCSMKLQNS